MAEISQHNDSIEALKQRLEGLKVDLDANGTEALRGAVIAERDLSNLNLAGWDLSNADLSGSNLSNTNFSSANLTGTKLCNTNISGTEFLDASLVKADLAEAQGENCGFARADLSEVNAVGAQLKNSSFSEANFTDAIFGGANLEGGRLRGANLTAAEFVHANLRHCDLEDAQLDRANFHLTDLHGCKLAGIQGYKTTNWIGVKVVDIDLHGAYLVRRHIMDENYLYEFRKQSKYTEFLYWIWWITSDCGRSLLRWTVCIFALIVAYGVAYTFVDIDYGDYQTPFSSMYYSIVTLTTLGYGDVLPASTAAQILAISEALFGYIGLGGMLSIFAQKMGRRAE